jgi:uncharacterized OB-fold protein
MTEYLKPIAIPDEDTKEFWDGCHRHELLIQKCENNHYRYPPRAICPTCFSMKFGWEKVNGRGEVYSFIIVRRPLDPSWEKDIPFVVADILLDQGVRMISNVIGCKPEEVKIGMKVEVVFEDATETFTLPKFKPVI